MKRQHMMILTIVALALALVVGISQAQGPEAQGDVDAQAALGTAFTYQGRLNDEGSPANGSYDLEFKLYDASSGGSQVGSAVTKADVAVSDGYFVVQLDFGGSAFNGDARWLQIGVRPGSSSGGYTVLSPRQALTPAPYALGLRGVRVDANGDVGIGAAPMGDYKLSVQGGNRGIYGVATQGTNSVRPYGVVASLDTDQSLLTGGGFLSDISTSNTPNVGFVFGGKFQVNDNGNKNARGLTIILDDEEANDYGLELVVDSPGYALRSADSGQVYIAGRVGLGTENPQDRLEVAGGNIRVTGGSFIDDGVPLNVPDYVFDKSYPLMSLDELRAYVAQHKSLPNVPNEAEIQANGLWLGEFQMRLLEKVEELTLYTLAQQETLEARQAQVIDLQAQNADLLAQMAETEARLAGLENRLLSLEDRPGSVRPLLLGWDALGLLAGGMLLGLVVAVRARLCHQGPGEER